MLFLVGMIFGIKNRGMKYSRTKEESPVSLVANRTLVTPGKCRDGTFNVGPGRHLPVSLPLPYPGLSRRCLKVINKIEIDSLLVMKFQLESLHFFSSNN